MGGLWGPRSKKRGVEKRVQKQALRKFCPDWDLGVPALKKHPLGGGIQDPGGGEGGGGAGSRIQGEGGRGLEGLDI